VHLSLALEILAHARREAEAIGVAMSFAAVDTGGHLVAFERMDGAGFVTVEIAQGKAYTAAATKRPTSEVAAGFSERVAFSAAISVATRGRFTPGAGALPVIVEDKMVGAVGASGGTPDQDVAVVESALAAVGQNL
jgi:uncharacterized protein GlcG (DUF336 family)